jgi:hypothetical protein
MKSSNVSHRVDLTCLLYGISNEPMYNGTAGIMDEPDKGKCQI